MLVPQRQPWSFVFSAVLLLTSAGLAFLILIAPISLRSQSLLPVEAGQVARQDIQSPQYTEFISEILTEQARQEAERSVLPVYSAPDPVISREQIEKLRDALEFIARVRTDASISFEEKANSFLLREDISLQPESITTVLSISDTRWATMEREALSVLEQVMRGTVREEQIETTRRNLSRLVSLELSEDHALLVAELVSPFIIPNSFYSPELTDNARQAARDGVQPVARTFLNGETIVSRGEVLTNADIEALTVMGLIQKQPEWQEMAGVLAFVLLLAAFVWLYNLRRHPRAFKGKKNAVLIALLLLIFLLGARIVIPGRTVLPYMYPVSAFGMVLAVLFGIEPALVLSIPLAFLAAYGMPNTLDLGIFYMLTSLFGVLALGAARRVGAFARAGVAVAGAGAVAILAFRIPAGAWDVVGITQLIVASIINGAISASVALILQYLFAQQLGLVTPLQLLEISRPDNPLLQHFLRFAPGTYQHSLQVSNLAEQAAESIGADTLLVRVGALYHDCGKSANADFFIENQIPGSINTHDDMPPQEAARIIIQHVTDGVAMARKHHLPERIQDFMREHHGTLSTRYQYNRAVEAAGGDFSKVDIANFRYPGPRPQSRETALLMLADGIEARARAERPADETAVRTLVRRVIEHCQQDGQFDDTPLTLRELHLITESFVATLRGTYHVRVQYPKLDPPTQPQKEEK